MNVFPERLLSTRLWFITQRDTGTCRAPLRHRRGSPSGLSAATNHRPTAVQPSGHVRGNLVNPLTSLADRRRVTSVHTVVFQSKSGRRRTERHTLDHFTSTPRVVHQHIADRNFYLATLLSVRGQMPLRARQSSFRFPCALQIRTSFPLHHTREKRERGVLVPS